MPLPRPPKKKSKAEPEKKAPKSKPAKKTPKKKKFVKKKVPKPKPAKKPPKKKAKKRKQVKSQQVFLPVSFDRLNFTVPEFVSEITVAEAFVLTFDLWFKAQKKGKYWTYTYFSSNKEIPCYSKMTRAVVNHYCYLYIHELIYNLVAKKDGDSVLALIKLLEWKTVNEGIMFAAKNFIEVKQLQVKLSGEESVSYEGDDEYED